MKKFLLPFVSVCIIGVMVIGVILLLSGVKGIVSVKPTYKYTVDDVFVSDIMNVVSEVNDTFIKPYTSDKVSIIRYFYNKNDEKEKQEKSIINYQNTYIQNKGVDYCSEEAFDVLSVYSGEVINIEESELYGKIVTIKHNDNLVTSYSNLDNVLVSVGNTVVQGELFATTSKSKFDKNLFLLHFEVKYNGENIDPETIYTLNVSSFN